MPTIQMTKAWWEANVSSKALKSKAAIGFDAWNKHCKTDPLKFTHENDFQNAFKACEFLTEELEQAFKQCGRFQGETKKVIMEMLTVISKYERKAKLIKVAKDAEWEAIGYFDLKKYPKLNKEFLKTAKELDSLENIEMKKLFRNDTIDGTKAAVIFIERYIVSKKANLSAPAAKKILEVYKAAKEDNDWAMLKNIDWKKVHAHVNANMEDIMRICKINNGNNSYDLI